MSASPFRDEPITTVDAEPVLARWRAEPLPFRTQLAMLVVGPLYWPVRGGAGLGAPDAAGEAALLGLMFVGRYRMAGLIPYFGPVRESWTDRDRAVRVSFRRARAHGAIEATMGAYILTTQFDDDTTIVTWSHDAGMTSAKGEIHRVGTGRFLDDYRSHRAAVIEHAAGDRNALRVTDLRTSLELAAWHDRRAAAWAISLVAWLRLVAFALVAMLVLGVAYALR